MIYFYKIYFPGKSADNTFGFRADEHRPKKMRDQTFDLNDYMEQFDQIKKMGSMEQLLSMIPGLSANLKDVQIDERQLDRMKAIIQSMTPQERRKPELLNASRRKRIAEGSGNTVQSVNQLIKQFEQTKKMMKELTGAKGNKKLRKMFGKNVKF